VQIATVDAAIVELACEVAEHPRPVLAPGATAVGTSTRRSTIWTTDRPDAAARDCSHARCRQEGEHHSEADPSP
jgi:hypothetical protein